MPLSRFHPAVQRWFLETLGEPTAAQSRGWTAIREHRHTLIAAPTGSGKTLAAFLTALDDLLQEGLRQPLEDEVRVVYVSPLKALSADIHKNLAEPRREIAHVAETLGLHAPRITAAVRTGDTSSAERAAMLRTPPHILVTTPESLFLLLTSERSRQILRTVRTVIVDEIHAVIGTRRGAHLALSLERLAGIANVPPLRIGLSATQKPIEQVARFLAGHDSAAQDTAIIDEGHRRQWDLGVELPGSPLDAVMAHEVWDEYYDRLASLVAAHKTTIVFVNTRRLAERLARHLSERLGEDAVTAHHGSLSKDKRLDAESRLKGGQLKALVATASLELGIDIGHVDLVCQVGSPHRIATLLQRVGRSGHTIAGTPKGRVFPTSRDDLVECAALVRAIRRGELDAIVDHDAPLDVLAQQIAAETACREYGETELFELVRRAWPYRALTRPDFDAVIGMLADGFATPRGRRAALVHRDEVNGRVRGRRGARLLALTSGGAIPEVADYRVVLDPDETFIGTLNEDFAIESMAGDVFQLGNASWRILQVGAGVVRVADAHGAPPNIPFWLGEAPARSDELSRAVSDLRIGVEEGLGRIDSAGTAGIEAGRGSAPDAGSVARGGPFAPLHSLAGAPCAPPLCGSAKRVQNSRSEPHSGPIRSTAAWLAAETGLGEAAADQIVRYLADGLRALGTMPSQETLVLERFFDESGGMQLVLHAPFGSRVNRAWGLALRKRFCRQFNFELQAAATEDAVMLSLGPQHSFPLADVFRYLHPATTRDVLVQAFLDAPVFQTRWRWNTTISLAVPRQRGSRKVPPYLQRMLADDLMAAVFPDAAACLENIPGDRQVPDHPLVQQTVRDCLDEAMDFQGLVAMLERIHGGQVRCVARDTPEPSVFAHEILNARPYAFLDDAPLEERRTQAVYSRRAADAASAADLGTLDAAAIDRVRNEARPDPRDPNEMHDALVSAGYLTANDLAVDPQALLPPLFDARRASTAVVPGHGAVAHAVWVAAERLPEILAIHPDARLEPSIEAPPSRTSRSWSRAEAITELLRGRLAVSGPTTASDLAQSLRIDESDADRALLALESEGVVLRGTFLPAATSRTGPRGLEWCDRRLLARIHRYTLGRLRAEIEPVSPADYMRFLFAWQHMDGSVRLAGIDGVREAVGMLDGFELAALAWERSILAERVADYHPSMLDMLCLSGEVGWARLSPTSPEPLTVPRLVPATAIALFLREHADAWQTLRAMDDRDPASPIERLGETPRRVLAVLEHRGASFFHEIKSACDLDDDDACAAVGTLVAAGLVASDGFAGVRALMSAARGRTTARNRRTRFAGRWSMLNEPARAADRERAIEVQAWTLLRRYGIVFRRILTREANAAPWRELTRLYRRLEARGEIRGGRFVSGMSGEQFALPTAVERLREVRRTKPDGRLITLSTADPLNLAGIITPGDRIRAAARNRMVYRDGVPISVMEGDSIRSLTPLDPAIAADATCALAGRRLALSHRR